MKLHKLLLEILSGDESYHRTYPINIYNVLKKDKIFLSTDIGDTFDVVGKNRFFLSLSRTKYPKMGFSHGEFPGGVIVFDTKKLNDKFKSRPFDYFKGRDKKRNFEYEDRIIYYKSYIDNVTKYIKRIDIIVDLEKIGLDIIYSILKTCEEKNIPIFLYRTSNDLVMGKNPINDKIMMKAKDSGKTFFHDQRPNIDPEGDELDSEKYYSNLLSILFLDKPIDRLQNDVANFAERRGISDKIDIPDVVNYYNFYHYNDEDKSDLMKDLIRFIVRYQHRRRDTPFRELLHVLNKQMREYNVKSINNLISAKTE
jgi:hypothetical protein